MTPSSGPFVNSLIAQETLALIDEGAALRYFRFRNVVSILWVLTIIFLALTIILLALTIILSTIILFGLAMRFDSSSKVCHCRSHAFFFNHTFFILMLFLRFQCTLCCAGVFVPSVWRCSWRVKPFLSLISTPNNHAERNDNMFNIPSDKHLIIVTRIPPGTRESCAMQLKMW